MAEHVTLIEFAWGFLVGGFFCGFIGYGLGANKARNECREILRECEQDAALLKHISRYS